ncbi:MAG TPA: hypothetical protein VLC09_01105 [Polyangiaceae bacterium]|nr:hypothetical protein [Polyangiaceae bacterium]
MSHAARCLHCNQDLSNAAAAPGRPVTCPACGTAQPALRSPAPPRVAPRPAGGGVAGASPAAPARPLGGPPAAPVRPAAASPARPAAASPARPAPAAAASPARPPAMPARPAAAAPARPVPAAAPVRDEAVANPFVAPVVEQAAANPFASSAVATSAVVTSAVEEPAANPFLASSPLGSSPLGSSPLGSSPLGVVAPAAAPLAAAPLGAAAPRAAEQNPIAAVPQGLPQGAPLRVTPGVEAPNVRDPHAEFRRGRWQKPALFGGSAAVLIAGLFVLVPGEEKPAASVQATVAPLPAAPAIGASLPPDRIAEPVPETTAQIEERLAKESAPQAAPERPAGIVAEKDFASAFKAAAKH